MQYLCALIQEIERDPNVREQLVYYPNDSLYEIGGKYRYVEYHYKKSQRQHTVASLEIDEALATLLNTLPPAKCSAPATAPTNPGASEPNRRTTDRYDTAVI